MLAMAFSLLTLQAAPTASPVEVVAPSQALGFMSQRFPYKWDVLLKLKAEVDGLKLNSIFFNKRQFERGFLKNADFGTRAQVEVTNTSTRTHSPSFAVAVFDDENRLLGVGTGGSKIGGVKPGETETFDMDISRVSQRMPKGTYFVLSVELK